MSKEIISLRVIKSNPTLSACCLAAEEKPIEETIMIFGISEHFNNNSSARWISLIPTIFFQSRITIPTKSLVLGNFKTKLNRESARGCLKTRAG
jgi:hypothetical protein